MENITEPPALQTLADPQKDLFERLLKQEERSIVYRESMYKKPDGVDAGHPKRAACPNGQAIQKLSEFRKLLIHAITESMYNRANLK